MLICYNCLKITTLIYLFCRVLIAYQNGLLVLWDVFEARIVFTGGGKDLQLKDEVLEASDDLKKNSQEETLEHHLGEKEISALCWASSSGSILAVGYIDGDILFWNMSSLSSDKGQRALSSSNQVVKLRLSSAERRLPVIVLQWSPSHKTHNDYDGQLFIYGGDEIGAEEVLTVRYSLLEDFDFHRIELCFSVINMSC